MPNEVPDVYANAFSVIAGVYDLTLELRLETAPGDDGTKAVQPVARVRMSLEHAKVTAILLKRIIKEHEDHVGAPVVIHPQACHTMGICLREDW